MRQQRRPLRLAGREQVGVVEKAECGEQEQDDKRRAKEAFHENSA